MQPTKPSSETSIHSLGQKKLPSGIWQHTFCTAETRQVRHAQTAYCMCLCIKLGLHVCRQEIPSCCCCKIFRYTWRVQLANKMRVNKQRSVTVFLCVECSKQTSFCVSSVLCPPLRTKTTTNDKMEFTP